MKLNLSSRLLAGALVLAASGSVFANTTIADGTTGNGSLFLNVVDTTAGTDYVLDLSSGNAGNTYKNFNGAAAQSFTLSDANWTAFKATTGSDTLQYNVVAFDTVNNEWGGLITSAAPTGTAAGSVGSTSNQQVRNNGINAYIQAVNGSTTASTNSLFVSSSASDPNSNAYFGTAFQLAGGWPSTLADAGTAMSFYKIAANIGNNLGKAPVTTFAGTWNLVGNALSYSASPVPLPMPVTLLLSGLALMGIIARRSKSTGNDVSFSGAAA